MPTELLVVDTVLFFLLAIVWGKSTWLNFLLKSGFFVLGIWNGIVLLQKLGYLIKTY